MDYEKKYKEALEKFRKDLGKHELVGVNRVYLEAIFPELKESIDERVKKIIKQVLSESTTEKDECYLDNGVTQQEVFAWLKKQGQVKEFTISQHENKTCKENDDSLTNKDERIRKAIIGYIDHGQHYGVSNKDMLAWLEKQNKKDEEILILKDQIESLHAAIKAVRETHRIELEKQGSQILANSVKTCKDEQKPAWSKEDDNCLSTIIAEFSKCAGKSVSKDEWMRCNDFLNSLKDRVQPKQEWSEENDDEAWLNDIISKAECNLQLNKGEINWLKSLKDRMQPQNRWKPSDEQMKS